MVEQAPIAHLGYGGQDPAGMSIRISTTWLEAWAESPATYGNAMSASPSATAVLLAASQHYTAGHPIRDIPSHRSVHAPSAIRPRGSMTPPIVERVRGLQSPVDTRMRLCLR